MLSKQLPCNLKGICHHNAPAALFAFPSTFLASFTLPRPPLITRVLDLHSTVALNSSHHRRQFLPHTQLGSISSSATLSPTMKLIRLIAASFLSLSLCDGFLPSTCHGPNTCKSTFRGGALLASPKNEETKDDLSRKATSFAAAVVLGWCLASNAAFALSDGDFADFSLPSYEKATSAEVNTNLKGDKFLLGEASKAYSSTSSSSISTDTDAAAAEETVSAPSAEDIKAEKAAAKAAQKAARERQKAAAEAAAAS